jgi:hypothetical protein
MLYLKLAGVEFKTAAEAAEVAKGIIDHGPSVDCYHRRIPGEMAWKKEVIWTVRVPAPRNCAALIKHLKARYPRSEWKLFEIDEDGYEIDLQPSVQPKTDPGLIAVKS